MGRYEVRLRQSVEKDFRSIPKRDVQRIVSAIAALADDPRPIHSRKLSGWEKYRLRCGVYRILYEIQEDILVVCVVKIAPRKEVYRD